MSGKSSIVVTGASTGIGYAIAELFAQRGWQVFGSVRKADDGDRLSAGGITPLLFDVTDAAAIDAAAARVSAVLDGATLNALVNNAGLAVAGPMLYLPMDLLRYQMEVNLIGPAKVTQAFGPLLGADRTRSGSPGRVVQISSTAGRFGVPFVGAYTASKHALEGMSESMRRELMLFGIDVIVIAPGAIVTPIWDKGELSDLDQYKDTPYGPLLGPFRDEFIRRGRKGLPVERVATAAWQAITARKPKLRYEVIPNRFTEWTLPKLMPKRLLDRVMARSLGLVRKSS